MNTKSTILKNSKQIFALTGYEGFSMRILADESGVGLSSIYHFFRDKDEILKEIFVDSCKRLGVYRSKLVKAETVESMLRDRILFQFKYIEDVIFILKYYLHFRTNFDKNLSGYLPVKSYKHIEEVLEFGIMNNELTLDSSEIRNKAKIITHSINGFLLEYYPYTPQNDELEHLVSSTARFLMHGLTENQVNS